MNENLPKWIISSITKHFVDKAKDKIEMYVEGDLRETNKLNKFCELRIDGPLSSKNHRQWKIIVEVNILISTIRDNDTYKIHKNNGLVASFFEDCIAIYKYGKDKDDDSSFLTTMSLVVGGNRERLMITNFGQVEPDVSLLQSTVEGHYEGIFEE